MSGRPMHQESLQSKLLEKRKRRINGKTPVIGDRRSGFKSVDDPSKAKNESSHEWAHKLGRNNRNGAPIDSLELNFREMAKQIPQLEGQQSSTMVSAVTHASGEPMRSSALMLSNSFPGSASPGQVAQSSPRPSGASTTTTTTTTSTAASIAANAASASAALAARASGNYTKPGSNSAAFGRTAAHGSVAQQTAAASAAAAAAAAATATKVAPSRATPQRGVVPPLVRPTSSAAKPTVARAAIGPGPPLGLELCRTYSSVNLGPPRPRPNSSQTKATAAASATTLTTTAASTTTTTTTMKPGSSSSSSSSDSSYTISDDGLRTSAAAAAASVAAARAADGFAGSDPQTLKAHYDKIVRTWEQEGHLPEGIGRKHGEALVEHWRKHGIFPQGIDPGTGTEEPTQKKKKPRMSTGRSSSTEESESSSEDSDSEGSESSPETAENKARHRAAAAARGEEPPSKRPRLAAGASTANGPAAPKARPEKSEKPAKPHQKQMGPPKEEPLPAISHNDTLGPYNSVFPASWMGIHPRATLQRFGPAIMAAASSPHEAVDEDDDEDPNDTSSNSNARRPPPITSPYGLPGITNDEELMAYRASLPRPKPLWTYQTARQPAPNGGDPLDSDEESLNDHFGEEEEEEFDAGRDERDPMLRELKRLQYALEQRDRKKKEEAQQQAAAQAAARAAQTSGTTTRAPAIDIT